ncbi:MAG: glycerophosphodiester phosphodiesterase, partial [Cyanobacteria bacterium REEB65]|nr:glycerophosphodiester phosphodiesterase [Cyanobacteria bacterium REEB65]
MQLIAHRGASGYAPENTMASFRLALEMGAKAIELDVHQTKDGQLVVAHDEDLKRTGKRKVRIKDLTSEELSKIDVGSWFDPCFSNERVPKLAEVFELVDGKAELHVELKRGSKLYPGIEEKVVEMIRRRKAQKSTLVSSFDHPA